MPIPYESGLLSALRRDRVAPSFFSAMPPDVIRQISNYYEFSKESEIGQALHYAAYARQEDIAALKKLLAAKPHLLLQRGRVITPGGHDIRNVTLYEFCLGAGDPELAEQVGAYFANIPLINGEAERVRQYERYRPHIDGIIKQEPYDLTPLIDLIKKTSRADVTAQLIKDMTHESLLRDAFIQFRKDHAPRVLSEPCMHYNYRSLQHALKLLDLEWENLYQASGNNYDTIRLVWRQLIGFEIRRLPGVDRCRVAQGLGYDNWERTYKYRDNAGELPVTESDDSLDGLGGDFAVNIFDGSRAVGCRGVGSSGVGAVADLLEKLISNKSIQLTELMPRQSRRPGV